MSFARRFLKTASASRSAGKVIGSALSLAGKGAKGLIGAGANLGAGIAEAAGAAPEVGTVLGGGAVIAGGIHEGRKAKRKVDEWRYRNGFYTQY